ncbi:MAG: hypothetical protein IPP34_20900 [Bacteroidetes bacterium]|nr:hypothetical protein [Bacteroidota bacterium]
MKGLKTRILALLLSFTAVFAGCDTKDDNPASPNNPSCSANGGIFFSARIDNLTWCADSTLNGNLSGSLAVSGASSGNSRTISIMLDDLSPGTYSAKFSRNKFQYTENGTVYESTNTNPGSITITEHNTSLNFVTGTFLVTLNNNTAGDKTLSNGSFKVYYTE